MNNILIILVSVAVSIVSVGTFFAWVQDKKEKKQKIIFPDTPRGKACTKWKKGL